MKQVGCNLILRVTSSLLDPCCSKNCCLYLCKHKNIISQAKLHDAIFSHTISIASKKICCLVLVHVCEVDSHPIHGHPSSVVHLCATILIATKNAANIGRMHWGLIVAWQLLLTPIVHSTIIVLLVIHSTGPAENIFVQPHTQKKTWS